MGAARIVIVRAGTVGATLAYACLIRGVGGDIVLHTDAAKVEARSSTFVTAWDSYPHSSVWGSTELDDCRGADVVVITAGAKQRSGQARMDIGFA